MNESSNAPQRVSCVQIEANVDDLDPRIWPHVIDALLAAGAHDAWITPIVMKKGRPAFTLGVLCAAADLEVIRAVVFAETSTIGLREWEIVKHVLERSVETVAVGDHQIDTKVAWVDGEVVNRSIEWDDVVRVSASLGLAPKVVLSAAIAAATDRRA